MRLGKSLHAVAIGLLVLILAQHVRAGTPQPDPDEIPKILLSGFDAYKAEGPEAAIRAWLKGSSIEGSKDALSQANVLRQVQDYYGSYKTFELIQSRNLTPTTRVIYLALNYEKGPLFAKFMVYKTAEGWILVNFSFNTKEELIIPKSQ